MPKNFICPYFIWKKDLTVRCEGARIELPGKEATEEFTRKYCASYQWQFCPLAQVLTHQAEKISES